MSELTQDNIDFLNGLRSNIIITLHQTVDSKKIISFLSKCAIIAIDDTQKQVIIGIPNEFI
jgi:hypothetical protein